MDPEPIPLRTLTVLLNYERTTSDWRLVNTRLLNTSFVDPNAWSAITPQEHKRYLPHKPTTLKEENIHIFHPYTEPENSTPLATCLIHPLASPEVQNLPPKTRDLIYNISRGNNGCYFAIYLYDHFFELCAKSQKISIQLGKEEPYLVSPTHRRIFEYKVHGPKLLSCSLVHTSDSKGVYFISSGDQEGRAHAVLAFPHPASDDPKLGPDGVLVVDMASLQYGEAGRGIYGEQYFMGTKNHWKAVVSKYCGEVELRFDKHDIMEYSPTFTPISKKCAERVWKKWQAREKVSWCSFCGVPPGNGVVLKQCAGCKTVRYCSREHQIADWKLHNMTCKKKGKEPEGIK